MTILATQPTPAAEAALALLELTYNAMTDAEPVLAQIGRAPDASPAAIELAVKLQRMLTDALAVSVELREAASQHNTPTMPATSWRDGAMTSAHCL
jgi:hypothetical protein